MIRIIVQNDRCKITGLQDKIILRELDLAMSFKNPGFDFIRYNNSKYANWDGRIKLFERGSFPIGLLQLCKEILDKNNVQFEIEDNRVFSVGQEIKLKDSFSPRWYQSEVVQKAFDCKSGVIRMCTGSGKTSVIAMMYAKFNVKTIVYVIGIELLYQMKETIERLLGVKCGIIGDGVCDIVDGVNICTIWSAAKAFDQKIEFFDSDLTEDKKDPPHKEEIKKLVGEAKMFILDECQYAGSSSLQMLSKLSKSATYRFLLSGTPWREAGDDILIEAVAGKKFYDLSASRLIEEGVLVPPKIHFISVPKIRAPGANYAQVYKNYITENEERNNIIISACKELVSKGRKVLILVSKIEHGKTLLEGLDGIPCDGLNGSASSSERLAAIKRMKQGKIKVLVASKIFDQGVDIPELDALILAGSGKSSARALQRIGRVIRGAPGKKSAIVIDFWDNAKYLLEHSKARNSIYVTEPLFSIKFIKGKEEERKIQKTGEVDWNDGNRISRKTKKLD